MNSIRPGGSVRQETFDKNPMKNSNRILLALLAVLFVYLLARRIQPEAPLLPAAALYDAPHEVPNGV